MKKLYVKNALITLLLENLADLIECKAYNFKSKNLQLAFQNRAVETTLLIL